MNELTDWSNLTQIRDRVCEVAYPALPRAPYLPRTVSALIFVAIVDLIPVFVDTLLLQFVVGALSLHLVEAVVRRIQMKREAMPVVRSNASVIHGLQPPLLGLYQGMMELHAERNREFPIQQNALLAIALILLPVLDLGKGVGFYLAQVTLGLSYFLLKVWEESRNQSFKWRLAARAIRQEFKS